MDIDIRQQIREYLAKENITLKELVDILNKNKSENEKTTPASLSNKLARGSIKYIEILEIFDALGYDIILQRRNDITNKSIKSTSSANIDKSFKPIFAGAGVVAGTAVGGILGSIVGGALGATWGKVGSTTGSKNETTITHTIDVTEKESLEMRLLFEMSINWEISELINKLIEYYTSNYVIEDKIEKVFKNYLDDDDILAVNTRLEKYCLPLLYLLNQYPIDGEILSFLTYIRNIYARGGLALLSDDELNELISSVRYYNEHEFIEKEN